MKIFELILMFLFFAGVYACNSSENKTVFLSNTKASEDTLINLSGKVLNFGPAFDSTSCSVIAECDCCADDLVFLNDKSFIRIAYCVAEKSVTKGSYTLNDDSIILQYDSLTYFKEADAENEIKTISKRSDEHLIKSEKNNSFKDTLVEADCNGKVFYKGLREKSFGTASSNDTLSILTNELKKEGFWKKLNLN